MSTTKTRMIKRYKKIKEGEILVKKGDLANDMYLLMSGSCIVTDEGIQVGKLKKYDVFGEAALFHPNGVRSASVVAKEDLKVLLLKRKDLQELIRSGDLDKSCVEALEKISKKRKASTASALELRDDQDWSDACESLSLSSAIIKSTASSTIKRSNTASTIKSAKKSRVQMTEI